MRQSLQSSIKNKTKDLDQRLLSFAASSVGQLKKQIKKHTHLDLEGDVGKQLAELVLQKAATIRQSLAREVVKKKSAKSESPEAKKKLKKKKSRKSVSLKSKK